MMQAINDMRHETDDAVFASAGVPLQTIKSINKLAEEVESQLMSHLSLDGGSSCLESNTHADDFSADLDDDFLSFMTSDNPWYNLLEDLASQPESQSAPSKRTGGANGAAANATMPLPPAGPRALQGAHRLETMGSYASSASMEMVPSSFAAAAYQQGQQQQQEGQPGMPRMLDRAVSSSVLPSLHSFGSQQQLSGSMPPRMPPKRTLSEGALIPKGPRSKKRGSGADGGVTKRQRPTISLQASARFPAGAEGLRFLSDAAVIHRAASAPVAGLAAAASTATASAVPTSSAHTDAGAAAPTSSQQQQQQSVPVGSLLRAVPCSGDASMWSDAGDSPFASGSQQAPATTSTAPAPSQPQGAIRRIPSGFKRRGSKAGSTDAYALNHACANCGKCGKTPQTRRGPAGNATLCNACGSRLLKGTYLAESAEAWPERYPVDHEGRVVYWPGQETRHCDMLARLSEVRAIAALVRDRGYRFFYNRGDGAAKAERNLASFMTQYGWGSGGAAAASADAEAMAAAAAAAADEAANNALADIGLEEDDDEAEAPVAAAADDEEMVAAATCDDKCDLNNDVDLAAAAAAAADVPDMPPAASGAAPTTEQASAAEDSYPPFSATQASQHAPTVMADVAPTPMPPRMQQQQMEEEVAESPAPLPAAADRGVGAMAALDVDSPEPLVMAPVAATPGVPMMFGPAHHNHA